MNNVENRYISCVEYYILLVLKDKKDISSMYYESYKSAFNIYNYFNKTHFNFTLYDDINKIQETLIKYKLLHYKVSKKILLKEFSNDNCIPLLLVNEAFFNKRKYKTLRDDHYILIKNDNGLALYNSYPISKEKISLEELINIYDNKALYYYLSLDKKININKIYKLFKKIIKKEKYQEIDYKMVFINYELQSSFYILKVLRYRLYDLCNYFKKNGFNVSNTLLNTINEAALFYKDSFIKIAMLLNKKYDDKQEISLLISRLNEYEKRIYSLLRKEFLDEKKWNNK